MSIKVIKPGLSTTVQDLGRYGYQKYGVIVSGAMDAFAFQAANLLAGNSRHAAALEITLTGPVIEWQEDALIAICGGNLSPIIDSKPVPLWRAIFVRKGSVLSFVKAVEGCRAYLAAAGGLQVPKVMGSQSTYIRAGLGGYEGRALVAGDVLMIGKKSKKLDSILHSKSQSISTSDPFAAATWFISHEMLLNYGSDASKTNRDRPHHIRIIKGQEFDLFTEASRHMLVSESFTVQQQSDRMGYRLAVANHKSIQLSRPYEMLSEAVTSGTIQIPHDGNPIILLADRQTTGGYPRIAQVVSVDLPLMAQIKPGEQIRFTEITHREAEGLYLQRERDMIIMEQGIMDQWGKGG